MGKDQGSAGGLLEFDLYGNMLHRFTVSIVDLRFK
jgi:hypothetical protein